MKLRWLDTDGLRAHESGAVLTIGNFDGVHLGHQALVAHVVGEARRRGAPACALTFDPHPLIVLRPASAPQPLMSIAQRAECLSELKLDRLFVMRFSEAAARQTPEEFALKILGRLLHARVVTVGQGFRFGRGRGGDVDRLETLGRETGFEVHHQPAIVLGGSAVSSTRIRDLIREGDVVSAAALLGRRHFTDGVVVPGSGRGKTLGFATANLAPPKELTPATGVYAAWCRLRDRDRKTAPYRALVNIGRRPTFGLGALTIEAHILGFEGDVYGKWLRLEYHSRLREERSFGSPDELRDQILSDRSRAETLLEKP